MILGIHVEPLKDNQEISFADVVLYHDTCSDRPLVKHRNIVSGDFTLKCVCGLEVVLPADGQAR